MEFDLISQKIQKEYYSLQQIQTQLALNKEQEEKIKLQMQETQDKVQLLDDALVKHFRIN